ncbi:MAG: hypothetical protein U0893_22555 [Chloroflexota bacterium]
MLATTATRPGTAGPAILERRMARQYGGTTYAPRPADDPHSWLAYAGRQVGPFRLERLLHVAGQMAFFATTHPTSGGARTARVEQVAPGTLALRRAQVEATATLALPDVPATYQVDVMDDMLVVITDPFDARPFGELASLMPLPPEQAIQLVSKMATTMDAVHARGFFHGRIWLRRDLSPALFDWTPAPGPFAPPGLSREFHVGRLDWVPGAGQESADRRSVDIVALEMIAWWLLTGRDSVAGAVGRGHALGAVAAALDRQFRSATELADAFAGAVRGAALGEGIRTDRLAQAGWRPWPETPASPPSPIGSLPQSFPTPPLSNSPVFTSAPLSNSPIFTPPLSNSPVFRSAPLSNSPVVGALPAAPLSNPPPGSTRSWPKTEAGALVLAPTRSSRLHTFLSDRRTLVATAGLVALTMLIAVATITLQVVQTIDGSGAASSTPVAGPATPAPPIAPNAPAQGALVAPPPSSAEIAEASVGQTILEAEALVAPANPRPDPDEAVSKLDRVRTSLAATSPSRPRVEDLETRILLDDAARRTTDALVLKDRRVLNEAGDRYEQARAIRPNDERIPPGLAKVQVTGWWLDFQNAFAEHDSDRQIDALQKIVKADPEFRSPEGPAREKLFAALVGKAEQAWAAGQPEAAGSLLDQADQLMPDSPAVRDRRAMWFPAPTATVVAQATNRPFPTPVPQQVVPQAPRTTAIPPTPPPTQAAVQPTPVPPTATRPPPPTATRIPPTPIPPPTAAPPPPTSVEFIATPPALNQPNRSNSGGSSNRGSPGSGKR